MGTNSLRILLLAGIGLIFAHNAHADGMTSESGTALPIGAGNSSYYVVVGTGDFIYIVDPQATPPSLNPAWIAAHTTAWINAHTGDNSFVPSHAVMAFNLAACPAGWSPLAGMAGRTVVGQGAYSEVATSGSLSFPFNTNYVVGATGGTATASLDITQMPRHNHLIRFGAMDNGDPANIWAGDIRGTGVVEWDWEQTASGPLTIEDPAYDGNHALLAADGDGSGPFTNAIDNGGPAGAAEGEAAPVDKRQPYVVLLYCEKN